MTEKVKIKVKEGMAGDAEAKGLGDLVEEVVMQPLANLVSDLFGWERAYKNPGPPEAKTTPESTTSDNEVKVDDAKPKPEPAPEPKSEPSGSPAA